MSEFNHESFSLISRQNLEKFPVNPDIWLYSVPKSGRTWLRFLFAATYQSHLAATHIAPPKSVGRLNLILFRDLRDLLVSYYHEVQYRPAGFGELGETNPHLAKRWVNSDKTISAFVRLGTIEAALNFYQQVMDLEGARLEISYEEMRRDTLAWLTEFVHFLFDGLGYPIPSKNDLATAVHACSFSNMRKLEQNRLGLVGLRRDGTWLPDLNPGSVEDIRSYKTRRGQVGAFREYLSKEDVEFIRQEAETHAIYSNVKRHLFAAEHL